MPLELIEKAEQFGNEIAICEGNSESSYAELLLLSKKLATALLNDKADLAESRVAYLVPAGAEYIATQWAIWRAGGIAVPLSMSATEAELEYTLTDSHANNIVISKQQIGKVEELCDRLNIRVFFIEEAEEELIDLPQINVNRKAMILYTSGTTSKPKGVVSTHSNIQAQIEALVKAWQWQSSDCIPLFLPLHHIHGIINVMSCALWSGARIESFPNFNLEEILKRVADNAYTLFMAVPTIYVNLIQALQLMPESQYQPIVDGFANMRLMVSGSAALPVTVHEKWAQITGQRLLERYGMTEIGMALSNPYEGERRPGTVGQPLPRVEIRLKSEQGDIINCENQEGEIQVRGPSVFYEYWNRTQATEDAFEDGWFRTGDIAVIEENYFRIMGRSSIDIIKSGGYKLSALEIESKLLDHPAIRECAVVGLPDETWGESVAVVIVLNDGEELSLGSLKGWCKDRLSHYKVPKQLLTVDQLPRNAMGKVNKPEVVKIFSCN